MSDIYAPPEPEASAPPSRRSLSVVLLGIAAAALLIVGIAAAIGGDDGDAKAKDPVALLTGAPDALREKGSAHVKATMAMQVAGRDVTFTMDGATEFASRRASYVMSMLGQQFEMISDGDTAYLHLPAMMRSGGVKEWIAFPITSAATPGSFDATTGALDALRGIGADVQELGTEDVNGVHTTHYRATVDLQDAIAAAPESQREQAREALSQLGTTPMPIDVWVSSDGLPIRQIITFDAPDGAGLLGGTSMKMTVDLTDFGAPVDVHVPPAAQVQRVDDPSKLGGMLGGTLG